MLKNILGALMLASVGAFGLACTENQDSSDSDSVCEAQLKKADYIIATYEEWLGSCIRNITSCEEDLASYKEKEAQ